MSDTARTAAPAGSHQTAPGPPARPRPPGRAALSEPGHASQPRRGHSSVQCNAAAASRSLLRERAAQPPSPIRLTPPRRLTLEQAIAYIDNDELVEVTPKSIRLRKRHLDPHERKRASRASAAA